MFKTAPAKTAIPHIQHIYRPSSQKYKQHAVVATRAVNPRQDLISAITQQAQREISGWLSDLLVPIISDNHGSEIGMPTRGGVPPTNLAEQDSKYINIGQNGSRLHIHYKERKPATNSTTDNSPTILLLHGFNGSVFNWRYALDALSQTTNRRVVAFDRPPFGLSSRPLDWGENTPIPYNPYSLEGSGQLTEEFLNALGIEDVVVVGHSAGAIVAMELQQRIPKRVKGIVLVAPAVPAKQGGLIQRMTLGGQLRLLLTRAILQGNTTGVRYVRRNILAQRDAILRGEPGSIPHSQSSLDTLSDYDELIEGYLKPLQTMDWDKGALLNLRSMSIPSPYDFHNVNVPVCVLQGKDDSLVNNALGLVERLKERKNPQAVTEFVELDCGHVPMEERVEEFNKSVSDFIVGKILKSES